MDTSWTLRSSEDVGTPINTCITHSNKVRHHITAIKKQPTSVGCFLSLRKLLIKTSEN